jgi:hypothetical protein
MKKLLASILLLWATFTQAQQQPIENPSLPDSGLFSASDGFIGLRLNLVDYNVGGVNKDLTFDYVSQSNGFEMKHDMNLKGLSNIAGIAFGVDETVGNHLLINFFNASVCYTQHAWCWNAGIGAGYVVSLNKTKSLMLRAYLNVFYQNLTYSVGSYTDTTLIGIEVNGVGVGTYIKNVKYVNNAICASPGLELLYRRNKIDFFLGAGYNATLYYKEKLDFYRTHISIGNGIYDSEGNPVTKGALIPGNYIIQLGIIKEFGL